MSPPLVIGLLVLQHDTYVVHTGLYVVNNQAVITIKSDKNMIDYIANLAVQSRAVPS